MTTPTRLTAEQRRRQLVGLGLELLVRRPILAMPLDEVAAEAGISRSLLFHYFPTKREYYAAVVRAAAERFLLACTPAEDLPQERRLQAIIVGFVSFIARRRAPYLALVRGTGGGDPLVVDVLDAARREIVVLVCDAVGVSSEGRSGRTVRAWLAFAEELALSETAEPDHDADHLADRLADSLVMLLDHAGQEAP